MKSRSLTVLVLMLFTVGVPRSHAVDIKDLAPERLTLTASDYAKRTSIFDARFKWVRESEVKGERFGFHPGSKSPHKVFTSIAFTLPRQRRILFPSDAFRDLGNPLLLSRPTTIGMPDGTLDLHFDGGDGERWYQAAFTWDRETRILKREIVHVSFGVWTKVGDSRTESGTSLRIDIPKRKIERGLGPASGKRGKQRYSVAIG